MSAPNASIKQKLAELDALLNEGIITKEEYQESRKQALGISAGGTGASPAVMGAIVPGANGAMVGVTPAIGMTKTDKLCYKDHQMAYLQNSMIPYMDGEAGGQYMRRVVCGCCMTQVELGSMYYMCGKCIVPFCTTCVESGKHRATSRDWHTGLFSCMEDPSSCCDDLLCNYMMQGIVCDRVTRGFEDTPTVENPVESGFTCRNVGLGCGLFWYDVSTLFIMNIFTLIPRQQLKRKYGIEENGCKTCMVGYFCRPCAECQMHREMTIRGAYPGGVLCSRQANAKMLQRHAVAPSVPLMGSQQSYQTVY